MGTLSRFIDKLMASTHVSSSWSELPPDLLGLVLPRLHSLADRVRIGAVCRPWRSSGAGLRQLPPPMPWVALGAEAYLDIVNGAVHRLKLTTTSGDADCRGSADHLLFLERIDGESLLANPFSGEVLPLRDVARFIVERTRKELFGQLDGFEVTVDKVAVAAHWPAGSSPGPVVAVAVTVASNINLLKKTIFVFSAGTGTAVDKEAYGTMSVLNWCIQDLTFFRGDLYALKTLDRLLVVKLREGSDGNPEVAKFQYVIDKDPNAKACFYNDSAHDPSDEYCIPPMPDTISGERYLVQSADQLLMVQRWIDAGDTSHFHVYEADFGATPSCWKPVRSLRGRALFVGSNGSKSVPVSDGHYGAQEDCIYFIGRDSGVYNMRDGTIIQLVPETAVSQPSCQQWIQTWVFPRSSESGSGSS